MIAKVTQTERLVQGCWSSGSILTVLVAYAYGYKTTVQKSAQHSVTLASYTYDAGGTPSGEGKRVAERKGTTLYWLLSDHLGSTSITATSSGSKTAELRYKAWGETRYTYGTTQTTIRYTGQREEASLGLYWYASRWYSASLGRFVSPDTIIPQPGNPQAWDRYSYVNSNPVRYTDPSGHKACEWDENGNCIRDPDWQPGIDKSIVSNTEILLSFDSKAIAEKAIPFSTEELRNWAMNLDHVALGIDSFAELIVLGFVVVGMIGGTTFEGNPVTGIPSGSGAGWIIGETNPVVQGLVTAGNISATLASTSSILGDLKAGDSRLQLQVSQATNTISLNGNVSISSSSLASGYLTTLGWAVRVVEGSLLVQGIAVAFDHGVVPTRNFSFSFNLQLPKR